MVPNSGEATVALRIRLAETVEELDAVRKKSAALEDEIEQVKKQLKLTKADLAVVNKGQVEMLAEVRKTVASEQKGVEEEISRLQAELKKANETAAMQLSQINSLLLDKVDLQSQGLAERDLRLQHEDKTRSTSSAAGSSEVERLKEELAQKEDQLDQTKDQLKKARNFIRQQDKLFKEQHQAQANVSNVWALSRYVC